MNRTMTQQCLPRGPAEDEGFCRGLPQVSATERDFWRRAVAEQRLRLDIAEAVARGATRHDAH